MKGKTAFRVISAIGLVISASDLYGIIVSSPICTLKGCLVVSQITPYGNMPFVIAGLSLFSFFIITSFYRKLETTIDFIVSLSLITEGALIGFQLFYIHNLCTICVTIAIIIALLFLIRFFRKGGAKSLFYISIAGFVALMLLSSILYIQLWHPDRGMTLIYSSNCPHCESVLKKIKAHKNGSGIKMVKLKKAKGYLINNGIKAVPVLIVRDKNIRLFIGEDQISLYLFKKNNSFNSSKILDELNLNKTDSCNFETDDCNPPLY